MLFPLEFKVAAQGTERPNKPSLCALGIVISESPFLEGIGFFLLKGNEEKTTNKTK